MTATANDQDGQLIFAQQVWALGQAGDILLAISSGNSQNVLLIAKTALAKNMLVIGLTGATGGKLSELCDITINVPSENVPKIQEMHLPIYHHICASVEAHFFHECDVVIPEAIEPSTYRLETSCLNTIRYFT